MTKENFSPDSNEHHVDGLLEERARLEKMLHDKFLKVITVMFTDLKGSTAIADTHGDMASRVLIKHHNDIVLPIIKDNNGILVKTMGDGTMSYFPVAQDAVRTAAKIQIAIDQFNLTKTLEHPILIRIGMHTGKGIVEQHDIFGDVVNVASRFESNANPGEIYLSEETYNSLTDKGEIYCRFVKTTTLKGKKEPFNIYKAFWNPTEIEFDIAGTAKAQTERRSGGMPLTIKAALVVVPIIILLIYFFISKSQPTNEKRTKQHNVNIPTENQK